MAWASQLPPGYSIEIVRSSVTADFIVAILRISICAPRTERTDHLSYKCMAPVRVLSMIVSDLAPSPAIAMTNKLLRVLPALLLLASAGTGAVSSLPIRRYGSIFNFGDSYADTGNNIVFFAERSLVDPAEGPPYGMTFFGHPTGRYSNGRLIIDFMAEALGVPFVPPFKTYNGSFRQGANFAVAGATALDASFFSFVTSVAKPYVFNASTNVQLGWFDSLKPSLCSNKVKCKGFFHKSVFFMGEFGVNDYSFSVFGKNLSQIRSIAPDVVKVISTATEEGAKTVVVPGIPPIGCAPSNLALFPNADPASYDPQTGCLKQLNDLAIYHNSLLQEAIKNVQTKHKDVKNQSFKQGANFAVAGATALKQDHRALHMQAGGGARLPPPSNISLSDELGWFDAMKPSLCSSPQACKEYFGKALFVVGELGWNDYGVMLVGGKSKLINDGATSILVSGISPMGCAPGNLVFLGTNNAADYESDTGCLKALNQLSKEHNAQLRRALSSLTGEHPGVRVSYGDLYTPVAGFAASPGRYGFDGAGGALRACCGGGGGRYNFNLSAAACKDPAAYVDWDGVHLTEAANRRVADGWLRGPYAQPPILLSTA
ncbi:hypothetical protein HU200_055969 [Digitaria exilis]|uniref:GDSL esterase/lipase n=1 Tax=Digitaria exilis TaxID=1010633 RepID=A0A835AJ81_9POAL|nr:hypothetical protein HU200_055969 [Digitaria exilis]